MRRRQFLRLLGSALAYCPLVAGAQQSAKPTIGFVHTASEAANSNLVAAFRQGMSVASLIESENATVEYRWADGRYDQLPGIIAELVSREAAAIVAGGGMAPALAARAATSTIPIVFVSGDDPVRAGLIPSLNRPGGNITGIMFFNSELAAKRIDLLRELLPNAKTVGYMTNPLRLDAEAEAHAVQEAARLLGLRLHILNATSETEIDDAFVQLAQLDSQALLVAADPFLGSQRARTTAHAAGMTLPVVGTSREYVNSGALISYGTSINDAYHQAGVYVGRIIKGEKPGDLPVLRPTKFEMAINLRTAKSLGVTVPQTLLVAADELIE